MATIQPGRCTGVDRREIWGWGLTIFSLTLPTWDGLARKGISSEPMREEDTGGDFFFFFFLSFAFFWRSDWCRLAAMEMQSGPELENL